MSSKKNVVAVVACQSNADVACINQDVTEPKEFNYMGLSDSTSTESSTISNISDENISDLRLKTNFLGSNFKETELRLGLPGSQSPEIDSKHCQLSIAKLDDKLLFPVLNVNYPLSQKTVVLGQKRPISVAMIEFSEGKNASNFEASAMPLTENTINFSTKSVDGEVNNGAHLAKMKEPLLCIVSQEQTCAANKSGVNYAIVSNNNGQSPAKVQVVGWPPIPSFRKINTLTVTTNNTKEEEEEAEKTRGIFVKVSMDGAPYLRKVDLKAYSAYQDLSLGLKKMFISFTFGQYGSHGAASKEITSEGKLKDMLHGCEYILTYEDKDGDLMLLGDVPWEMFVDTCKRLRIMKGLDAIGLAPRAMKNVETRAR